MAAAVACWPVLTRWSGGKLAAAGDVVASQRENQTMRASSSGGSGSEISNTAAFKNTPAEILIFFPASFSFLPNVISERLQGVCVCVCERERVWERLLPQPLEFVCVFI